MAKTGVKTESKNGGRFSKENPRPGPGRGKKRAVAAAASTVVEEMEKGYTQPPAPGDSPGVKAARKLAVEDYPKFLALYLKAKEVAGEKEVPQTAEVYTAEVGEKEEKIEELAKRLLDEWEKEEGEANGTGPIKADDR